MNTVTQDTCSVYVYVLEHDKVKPVSLNLVFF